MASNEIQFILYNLDAIIALGYRVSSLKATPFRQWATKVLNEYIQKGFVMDDERLKQAKTAFGKGTVRRANAERKAEEEYRLFNPTQQINSDFDNYVKGLFENENG